METGRTETHVMRVFSYICYIISAKNFILVANGLRLELVITEGRAQGIGGAGKV